MAGDPYYSNVSVLAHFDASPYADSGPNILTLTNNGTTLDTTNKKFGTASASFDGANDSISISPSSGFSFDGDFTLELQARPTTTSFNNGYAMMLWYANGQYFGLKSSNLIAFQDSSGEHLWSWPTVTNSFTHIALTREGTTLRAFADGTQLALTQGGTESGTVWGSSNSLLLGVQPGEMWWPGNMDELRITKGIARYTTNFTPPTAAFPNSGGGGLFVAPRLDGLGSGGPFFGNVI
jgi:hypothetical protein